MECQQGFERCHLLWHPRSLTNIAPEKWWDWKVPIRLSYWVFGKFFRGKLAVKLLRGGIWGDQGVESWEFGKVFPPKKYNLNKGG